MIELSFDILLIFSAMGQAVFFAVVLWHKRRQQRGEIWLSALMLLFAIELFYTLYYRAQLYHSFPLLIGTDTGTEFLYGPFLWLFIRRYTDDQPLSRWRHLLHFSLFILIQSIVGINLILNDDTAKLISMLDEERKNIDIPEAWELSWFDLLTEAQIGAYLAMCWSSLRRYRDRVSNESSNIDRARVNWLRSILIGLTSIWGLLVVIEQTAAPLGLATIADKIFFVAMSVLVFYLCYQIWTHFPYQFVLPTAAETAGEENEQEKNPLTPKYQKSALDDEALHNLYRYIEEQMRARELWRDADLDLSALSENMELPSHYVSQVINTKAGCNFYDYVNRFRIDFIKTRLQESEDSILDLAFDAGFNSKSAFYQAFKRHTDTTPSAYRNQQRSMKVH